MIVGVEKNNKVTAYAAMVRPRNIPIEIAIAFVFIVVLLFLFFQCVYHTLLPSYPLFYPHISDQEKEM